MNKDSLTINEKPFVDIILPNYNSEKFIAETINSIINQTYKNWKLYVIDDHSNDNSKEILKSFENKINIFPIFINKNMGVAFCRNLGIRISKSKYVSFIDHDDIWSKTKLEEQIDFMEKHNHQFTYTNYTVFVEKNGNKELKKQNYLPSFLDFEKFIKNSSLATSSMIISRSLIGKDKFTKIPIEDYFFKCKLLKKNKMAVGFNKNLLLYRLSKKSLRSNRLKTFYSIWYINRNLNKLSFIKNIISISFLVYNSLKNYGIR